MTPFYPAIFLFFALFHPLNGQSISDNKIYPKICELAVRDETVFANFKRELEYQRVLEHVSYELGLKYLEVIAYFYKDLLPSFEKFRENDLIGNPIRYNYYRYGRFSPTTLRYIKVAGDLKRAFGDLKPLHILEIGGGYGGQCKILSDATGFASYTIIDLPSANRLAKKVLDILQVKNVFFIDCDKLSSLKTYDLVISNYSFSEVDRENQLIYLEKVIKSAPRGYMTMNFFSARDYFKTLSIQEVKSALDKNGAHPTIENESPCSAYGNRLIKWDKTGK